MKNLTEKANPEVNKVMPPSAAKYPPTVCLVMLLVGALSPVNHKGLHQG